MTKSKPLARQPGFFIFLLQAALWLFPFWLAMPAFAQLQIVSRSPDLDDIHATASTTIRVGFNQAVTNFANGIQVWGNFHGRYSGTLNSANQSLVFTPSQSFVDGEEITVAVTTTVRGADGTQLIQPYIWRFLVRTDNGTGTFTRMSYDLENAPPPNNVNQEPTHLVPGDFNNDNYIDLAVVHHGANRLVVLRNTGDVSLFEPFPKPPVTGNTPVHAAAAHFNNDNFLDLALVNFNSNSLQIFPGNGNGQFAAPQTIFTGARPIHVLAQDFNGDGFIDLAVTMFGADRVDIFLNNGSGSFPAIASQSLQVGFGPVATAAWDYDQNGALDIIVANHGAKSLSTLFNNGRGNFASGSTLPLSLPPVDLVSGDVVGTTVGDGRRELLALCSDFHLLGKNAASSPGATSELAIINFANNQLNLAGPVTTLAGYAQALTLCNVDTLGSAAIRPDRDLDIFYTRFRDDRVSWLRNPDNNIQAFSNLNAQDLDTARVTSAKAITHFDLDRDGDNDLIVSNYLENQLVVYINQGARVLRCTPFDNGIPVSEVNFGNVWVRRDSTRSLRIINSNSLALSINTTLSDSINFSVSPRGGSASGNSVFSFEVPFMPSDTGFYQSNLLIRTNDGVVSTSCSVTLRGRGVRATIVAEALLDFGCVAPGDTATRPLRIENTGNIPLVLSNAVNLTRYFMVRDNLNNRQIPPRSSIDVPIDFTPDSLGNFLDSLKIRSNDRDRPIAAVVLRGCGSPPENDPPAFDSISDKTVFEGEPLVFPVIVRDPEGNAFVLTWQNLPNGATVVDQGNGQWQFSWRPALGTAGQYQVTFEALEQNTAPPLRSILIVNITVLRRQPDLYISALSGVRPPVRLNQAVTVTAVFADSSAPAQQSFNARLLFDEQILADTVIAGLQIGANVTLSRTFRLASVGRHSVQAVIDVNNTVAERDENNNSLRLEFDVQPGQLTVAPNPFTPNNDGFNDAAVFELGNVGVQSPQLKIFDLHGNLLKTIASAPTAQLRWDGNDNSGKPQPPGPYLYLLFDVDKKVASGYVVLAR